MYFHKLTWDRLKKLDYSKKMVVGIQLNYEVLVREGKFRDMNKQATIPRVVFRMVRDLTLKAGKR